MGIKIASARYGWLVKILEDGSPKWTLHRCNGTCYMECSQALGEAHEKLSELGIAHDMVTVKEPGWMK